MIESGKDIYGEKPLSRWIAQGVKLKKLVRQYGTIFQVGLQQRSDPKFRLACNLARNGYLGKISEVQVAVPGGTVIPAVPPCDPPEGFDWDMWTGPAPMFPFDPRRVEWLGLYMISDYCAGFITNWGVHHLDIAGWGVPEIFEKPFEVSGRGILPDRGMADTWISWRMQMQYESGLVMNFCNTGNPYEQGCRFIGDQGWVHVNRAGIKASDPKLLANHLERHRYSPARQPVLGRSLHGPYGRLLPLHAHAKGAGVPSRAGTLRDDARQRVRHLSAPGTNTEMGPAKRLFHRRRPGQFDAQPGREKPVDHVRVQGSEVGDQQDLPNAKR